MVYVDAVMALNFCVDLLLLMGTNLLAGFPPGPSRAAAAAALGGVYGGICLYPGFRFLGHTLWRTVVLVLMAVIAFGCARSALRRGVLFILLSMALGGIALGLGKGGAAGLIGSAAVLVLLCYVGFRGKLAGKRFENVVLEYDGRIVEVTALYDTGNQLTDPVTGSNVLVTGPEAAKRLLDLEKPQLMDPVETMTECGKRGLRLIPYSAVGISGGMLLAVRVDRMRIGGKEVQGLVAFAPDRIGNGQYQALLGGA